MGQVEVAKMSPTSPSWTPTWPQVEANLASNMTQKSEKWASEGCPEANSNISQKNTQN
jgi:hypothetical protein